MIRNCLLLFVFTLILASCTTRHVEPTRSSRRTIDTLYQKQVLMLQPRMDSACAVISDSLFQSAVDSLLTLRHREMKDLIQ